MTKKKPTAKKTFVPKYVKKSRNKVYAINRVVKDIRNEYEKFSEVSDNKKVSFEDRNYKAKTVKNILLNRAIKLNSSVVKEKERLIKRKQKKRGYKNLEEYEFNKNEIMLQFLAWFKTDCEKQIFNNSEVTHYNGIPKRTRAHEIQMKLDKDFHAMGSKSVFCFIYNWRTGKSIGFIVNREEALQLDINFIAKTK